MRAASTEFGLPTALDDEVILGLVQVAIHVHMRFYGTPLLRQYTSRSLKRLWTLVASPTKYGTKWLSN